MELTIHRGTRAIGGSCVELKTARTRILVDFGMPLVDTEGKTFDSRSLADRPIEDLKKSSILPDICGLYKDGVRSIDAILISHSHMDHYGLLNYVHPDISIYLSRGANELVEVSNIFTPSKVGKLNTQLINGRKVFTIGDFTVTPHLVDHSAFDALAFLIEGDGQRVFYSGDFRGHGRKSVLFKRMVENPPKDIDCLLMEGSMLGRGKQLYQDEKAVEGRIEEILKDCNNITFLFVASQNIDRLVSAYKACLKTDKIFVIDIYTAFILDRLRKISKNIPQFNWKNIRIKFLKYHADSLAKAGYRDLLYVYNKRKIDLFEINRKKNNVLMVARDNSVFPLIVKEVEDVKCAKIIYSMWEGYLTEKFRQYCDKKGLLIEQVHTSGHAVLEDLTDFSNVLNPRALVPIHTFEANKYPSLFKNVKVLRDGEVFDLALC